MKNLNDNIKPIIGVITVFLVFLWLFGITFLPVKISNEILLSIIVAIVGFGKDIYGFFFGSSQGASKKDDIIGDALNKAQDNPITPTPAAQVTATGDNPTITAT